MKENASQVKMSRLESYYLTTNRKGVLIVFLVMYHFVSGTVNSAFPSIEQTFGNAGLIAFSPLLTVLLSATPIFVFITGFGSKDTEACRNTAFTLYFLPYLILTLITALEMTLIKGLPIRLFPFDPLMQLWFLLSMFIWMLTLKDVARIKFILPVSVIVMLVIGMMSNNGVFAYSSGLTTFFGLSRVFYYFPFLLLGFFTGASTLGRIRKTGPVTVVLALLLFLAIGAGAVGFCAYDHNFSVSDLLIFKGDGAYFNYLSAGSGSAMFNAHWKINLAGAAITVILCAVTRLLLFLLLRLMPKKKDADTHTVRKRVIHHLLPSRIHRSAAVAAHK